jgi:hypothetical protein
LLGHWVHLDIPPSAEILARQGGDGKLLRLAVAGRRREDHSLVRELARRLGQVPDDDSVLALRVREAPPAGLLRFSAGTPGFWLVGWCSTGRKMYSRWIGTLGFVAAILEIGMGFLPSFLECLEWAGRHGCCCAVCHGDSLRRRRPLFEKRSVGSGLPKLRLCGTTA